MKAFHYFWYSNIILSKLSENVLVNTLRFKKVIFERMKYIYYL